MRSFYFFKLFQFVVTFVFLFNMMSFVFYGKFVSPQCFLKSAVPTGHCDAFTTFQEHFRVTNCNDHFNKENLNAIKHLFEKTNATDDEKKYMDCVTSHLPTGDRIATTRFSFVTALKNTFYGIKRDRLQQIADLLALVRFMGIFFIFFLFIHALRLRRLAQTHQTVKYDGFGYYCVYCSVVIWVSSTAIFAWLSFNWTARWECTNFVPDSSHVLLTVLILSIVLMSSSFFDLFFGHSLLQSVDNCANTTANNTSATVKEVFVKANVKNGELSTVVIKA